MTPVAKLAAECVKEMVNSKDKNEYLSVVKGLGSFIIQNGLAGTILFVKKKGPEKVIEHLDRIIELQTGVKNFSKEVIDGNELPQQKYIQMQYAALEGIKWLRRYADILLGGD